MLNYFGQGAWLLEHPDALLAETFNPFFGLVPEWGLYPMIVIATAAAVVASQALISGAFSLTQQAIQLGFVPRMRIIHTSISEKGQIYMPGINWALWVACIGLVVALPSSTKLAATYGVAVTGAMLTTTLLFAIVMRRLWKWPMWKVAAITSVFAMVDVAFLGANLLKIPAGGWFPIVVAAVVFLLMTTWKKGRRQITAILRESSLPLDLFVPDIGRKKVQRVPGTAVFMTSIPNVASPVLLHHLKHNKVLHERVIMVTVQGAEIPTIPDEERVTVEAKGEGFYQVIATYGFTESPDVPALLLEVGESLQAAGRHHSPQAPDAGRLVLSRPRDARGHVAGWRPAAQRWADAGVARAALRADDEERTERHRVFRLAAEPRDRTGGADSGLMEGWKGSRVQGLKG